MRFGRTPTDIAEALHAHIDDVAATVTDGERVPTIVLVSPVRIDDTAEWFEEVTVGDFAPEIVSRSRDLTNETRRVAQERGVLYADAAQLARVGADGLHFSLDSHPRFVELVATTASQALPVFVAPSPLPLADLRRLHPWRGWSLQSPSPALGWDVIDPHSRRGCRALARPRPDVSGPIHPYRSRNGLDVLDGRCFAENPFLGSWEAP